MFSLQDWFSFLQQSNQTAAVPLLIGGAAMLVFGWRMWKLCVLASFALIGVMLSAELGAVSGNQIGIAVAAGAAVGLVSLWSVGSAVSVLGGLIGGIAVTGSLRGMGIAGPTLWCLGGLTVIVCTAMAYLNRQLVVVLITASLGSVLLMSGLARLAMLSPALFGSLRAMISSYGIVLPFIIIVPGVISSFYQLSEIHRVRAEV